MADHKNRYERHQDTMSYLWLLTFGIQDTLSYNVLKKCAILCICTHTYIYIIFFCRAFSTTGTRNG